MWLFLINFFIYLLKDRLGNPHNNQLVFKIFNELLMGVSSPYMDKGWQCLESRKEKDPCHHSSSPGYMIRKLQFLLPSNLTSRLKSVIEDLKELMLI